MQPKANLQLVEEGPREGGGAGGVGWGFEGARVGKGGRECVQLLADLGKLDKGSAKLLLVSRVQTQAGLFHFPSLPEIILVVAIHKDGGSPLMGVQDLIWKLQSMRRYCLGQSNCTCICSTRKHQIAASHHFRLTVMKVKKTFLINRQSLNTIPGDAG